MNENETECCRICYEQNSKNLISPCLCSGTAEFIHEECLKSWIKSQDKSIDNPKCEICGYSYKSIVKFEKKFNPRKAMIEEFLYCCMIPIYITIIIVFTVVVIILALFKLDFNKNPYVSWCVVGGCCFSIIGCVFLLVIAIYKILYVKELTEWKISSIDKSIDSSNIKVM